MNFPTPRQEESTSSFEECGLVHVGCTSSARLESTYQKQLASYESMTVHASMNAYVVISDTAGLKPGSKYSGATVYYPTEGSDSALGSIVRGISCLTTTTSTMF